jgi:hypothetical protein
MLAIELFSFEEGNKERNENNRLLFHYILHLSQLTNIFMTC